MASVSATPTPIPLFGDSTQAGVTAGSADLAPPALAVQELLRQAGHDMTVSSHGIPGTYLYQLLSGADGTGRTWSQKLADSGASIVVDNHGINDSWAGIETPLDDYRASLRLLVAEAKAQGKVLILETPNPVLPVLTGLRMNIAAHEAKVQAMRDVGLETGTPVCDVNEEIRRQGMATPEWISDGVHPTRALYQGVIASKLASCITLQLR